MFTVLPGIKLPQDTDSLWKYMNLEKFISLLDTESLFFTRADKFDDPFEGFMPPTVRSVIEDIEVLDIFREKWRKYVMCSCWHHAEEESMAMWEKYHMNNSGIALRTTFGNFKECLGEGYDVFIGKIEYINHYEYIVPQNISDMDKIYTWYFHKRKAFEHEREFRAILAFFPFFSDYFDSVGKLNSPEILLNSDFPDICDIGIQFNIDVNILIDEVITSPYIDGWVTDIISSVAQLYGYNFDVNGSLLLDEPNYFL